MTQSTSPMAPVYDAVTVARLYDFHLVEAALAKVWPPPAAQEGYVTFFDVGWSLLEFRRLVGRTGTLFYSQDWYDNEAFAKFEERPRYRQLQMTPARDSLGKTFAEQQALVPPDAEIPTARVVLMGMVIRFLATGERLFSDHYVRCVDETSGGCLVSVGYFDSKGVLVCGWNPSISDGGLGVVLARKF